MTDSLGNIKSESDFYPWGGELQFVNNDSNHYKFTGKERDTETGLDYFGARYYSNGLGRWISADWSPTPIPVPYADLHDPQTLNLYGFVGGNPGTKIDKDGHCLEDACLIEAGVAVSFFVIASSQYLSLPSNQRSLAAAASYASSKISGWFQKSDNNSKALSYSRASSTGTCHASPDNNTSSADRNSNTGNANSTGRPGHSN